MLSRANLSRRSEMTTRTIASGMSVAYSENMEMENGPAHPVSSPLERHISIKGYVATYTGKAVGRSSAGCGRRRDRHQRLRGR